jgi:hypothetical protein
MKLNNIFLIIFFILLTSCVNTDKPISQFTLKDIAQLIFILFIIFSAISFITYIFDVPNPPDIFYIKKILNFIYDNFQTIFLIIILLILILLN